METQEEGCETSTSYCPWQVVEENEARYNFSDQKGLWQPKPEDILSMFEQLAKGKSLPLKWTCPGRRAPGTDTPNENETETEMEVEDDQQEELSNPVPSTFDFDDSFSDANPKVTPWRSHTAMGRTPKTEKRVARMGDIMDSLRKQQIQRAAEREARKIKSGSASRNQQGRGRLLKFGSPTARTSSPVFSNASETATSTMETGSTSSTFTTTTTATTSASATTPPGVENVPSSTPSDAPSEIPNLNLESQEMTSIAESERKHDNQTNKEEKDSAHSENAISVPTEASSSTTTLTSESGFVTISSNQHSQSKRDAKVFMGLNRETSNGQKSSAGLTTTTSSCGISVTASNPSLSTPLASLSAFLMSTPPSENTVKMSTSNVDKNSIMTSSDCSQATSSEPARTETRITVSSSLISSVAKNSESDVPSSSTEPTSNVGISETQQTKPSDSVSPSSTSSTANKTSCTTTFTASSSS